MVTRALPKSSTCLRPADYLSYLGAPVPPAETAQAAAARVRGPVLPRRQIVATPTGRHALWAFLELVDLQPGAEVIVPAYNFYVIVRLLVQRGLRPVFADVEPDTLCLDPRAVAAVLGPRTRMVLVTHIYGHPADLTAIRALCDRRGLLLFEDCAHAVGTRCAGEQVGQTGDGALFSFGVEKLINSFGGGLLAVAPARAAAVPAIAPDPSRWHAVTDSLTRLGYTVAMSPAVYRATVHPAARVLGVVAPGLRRRIRDFFEPSKDDPAYRFSPAERPGYRGFMARLQARQLARLDANLARRRALVARMRAGLARIPEVAPLDMDRHGRANASYFAVRVPDATRLAAHLVARGIGAHPREFLDCAALVQFEDFQAACPVAHAATSRIVRLPSYPALTDEDADRIVAEVARFFAEPA